MSEENLKPQGSSNHSATYLICILVGIAVGAGATFLFKGKSGGNDPIVANFQGEAVRASDAFTGVKTRIFELEEEIYRTKEQALNDHLEDLLLDQESKKENLSKEQLLEKLTGGDVGEVEDQEVAEFLNSKGLSLDDPRIRKDDVKDYLKYQRRYSKRQGYVKELMKKANVKILLKEPTAPKLEVDIAGYPTWGNQNAPVTIIEFSDFQCPFCSRAVPTLTQIKKDYGPEKVKIVYRDMPLPSHDRAEPASLAAHCAGEQGKFWEYHDMLFENQDGLADEDFKGYAQRLQLDAANFEDCFKSKRYQSRVDKSRREAEALGIQATPSFVINGILLQGAQGYPRFKEKIDRVLN